MRILGYICILNVLTAASALGQNQIMHHDTLRVVHTQFITKDSTYSLTRIEDSTCLAHFIRDFASVKSYWEGQVYIVVDKSRKKDRETNVHSVNFVIDPNVDTLMSYSGDIDYALPTIKLYEYINYPEDELTMDATQAYWFRALGILQLDSSNIYFLNPIKNNNEIVGYELLTIENYETLNTKYLYNNIISMCNNTFRIGNEKEGLIKKKNRIRMIRSMNELLTQKSTLCLTPRNSDHVSGIYLRGVRYLLAEDCILRTSWRLPQGAVYSVLTSICNEVRE